MTLDQMPENLKIWCINCLLTMSVMLEVSFDK